MKKKALALILSLTMLVSSVVPGLLVSANGTTTSDITTIEEVETPLSSGEDETQPPEGGSTTNPTNPGEGGTEGGTTNPGEGGTEGGTTNPGEGGTEGGTTNPGEGGAEGGTTNPGEGGAEGGTTNPGEGGNEGGTTNPGEGGTEGGETDISAEELYNRFMACKTIEEIEALKAQVSEEDWAKLTDEQKAKIEEYIANLKGEGETDVSAEELYNRFMACKTIEEIEELKAQISEEDWAKLSEEQKKAIEEYIETLKAQTETAKFEDRYNRIMSAQTSAEVEAIIKEFADEAELEAFMKWMQDNGKLEALQQHLSDVYASEYEAPVTVSVTNAGPLLPPIYVGGMQRAFSATPFSDTDKNGLDLSKTVTANEDGTYTITLEAFTTGTVTTEQKDVPLDIVLVLDQSGSMNDSFGNTNRQTAMKTAVNNFIDSVGEKYSPETGADHRIALVEFRSEAKILKDWTDANSQGVSNLKTTVNGLSEGGATNVGDGMAKAQDLINRPYTGPYTKRQQVVIVFTDGVPTTSSDFDTGVANAAISAAKAMKEKGVTVYTIGIFNGANPNELFGEKWDYLLSWHEDIPCTGEPGSYWGGSWAADLFGGNDFAAIDVPAGNRFLNYLSSKYDTDRIGIERGEYNPGNYLLGTGTGYKITENFTPTTSDNYYLTASDESGLNDIFQSISDQISNPSISLGTTATVKDVISPYFTVPSEGDVKVYTEDAVSGGFSGTKVPFEARIEVKDGTIAVSNFDFDKNFVTPDPRKSEDGTVDFYGKKLIVEIKTSPKQGFLGGNNVPTNGEKSGLYITKDGQEKMVEEFAIPHTDVAIPAIKEITAADKNVYLMQGLTEEQLKEGVTVTLNGRKPGDDAITLDLNHPNYGLEEWQTKFVTIDVKLTDDEGQEIKPEDLIEDQTYNVKVTISPKQPATEGEGVPSQNKTGEVQINVFKPEITWKDSQIDLGDTPNYQEQNFEKVEWKHKVEGQPETIDKDVTMTTEQAPVLSYDFNPPVDKFDKDTNVTVTVKIGDKDIKDHVTFKHEKCDFPGCPWKNEATQPKDAHFTIHIKSFDLTITKTVEGEVLDNQTFVFTVQRNDSTDAPIEVVIKGANSKTIKGLPSGTYTVTEKTDWSWRYNAEGGNQQTVTPNDTTAEVTFNNALKPEQKWLNGYAYQANDFVTAAKNLVNTLLSVIK